MASKIARLEIEQIANEAAGQWGASGFFVFNYRSGNLQRHLRRSMRLNSYMLALCTLGWVRVRVNGEEILYGPRSCSAFVPSTVHEILEASEDYACQTVVFRPDFLLKEYQNVYQLEKYQLLNQQEAVYMQLAPHEALAIADHFGSMQRKLEQTQHPFRDSIIRNQLFILLAELEYLYRQQRSAYPPLQPRRGKEKLLAAFQELVQEHFTRQHGVVFYAARLAVTPKCLGELLKAATGKTTKELIDEALLTEAKVLLQSGSHTVSETAGLLGYANLEVFCRFFKNKTGSNPLKFSRQYS